MLGIPIDQEGAAEIACRARGTPRIVNRLIKRVRDYAQMKAEGEITRAVAEEALAWLGVDAAGFDEMDRHILLTIIDKFSGGPVGWSLSPPLFKKTRAPSRTSTNPTSSRLAFWTGPVEAGRSRKLRSTTSSGRLLSSTEPFFVLQPPAVRITQVPESVRLSLLSWERFL